MKPDLYQQDFDGLVRKAEEIAARPRALYGIEPTRNAPGSSPFEWIVHLLWKGFLLFCAAVLLVIILALAFAGGTHAMPPNNVQTSARFRVTSITASHVKQAALPRVHAVPLHFAP